MQEHVNLLLYCWVIYIFFRFFPLILPYFRLFSSYVGGGSPPKFFLMKSGKHGFSSLIMPKLLQLVLFKNIIFFYVNQSNHLLTLTYLGGCFTPINTFYWQIRKNTCSLVFGPLQHISRSLKSERDTWGTFLVNILM